MLYAKATNVNENDKTQPVQAVAVQAYAAPPVRGYNPNYDNTIPTNTLDGQYIVPKMRELTKWNVDLFERCCSCTGNCWLTWLCFCPIISVHSRSSNMHTIEGEHQRKKTFIASYSCVIMCLLLTIFVSPIFFQVFLLTLAIIARIQIRKFYNIEGNNLLDCCTGFWCTPCSIIQLSHQIWDNPEDIPGCDCGESSLHVISNDPFNVDMPVRSQPYSTAV